MVRTLIVLSALIAGAMAAEAADGSRVAAVVNGEVITTDDVTEAMAVGGERPPGGAPIDDTLRTRWLRLVIQSRLLSQEADRRKISVSDAEVASELLFLMRRDGIPSEQALADLLSAQGLTLESFKKHTRARLKATKLFRRTILPGILITDEQIQDALEANRASLEIGLPYRVQRIVVAPPEDTEAAWDASRLRAETLHAELASGRAFEGGDLGVLRRGEGPADLEAEIARLAPGQMSKPYRSADGYHIVRLEEREALSPEELRCLRPHLREVLHRRTYDTRCTALIGELRQRAVIQIPGQESIPPAPVVPRPATLDAYREAIREKLAPFYVYPCIKNPTTSVCEYRSALVLVTVRLYADGRLAGVAVEQSSGMPIYDQHAANTVKLAAPFDPIPDELRATGVPAAISFRFVYPAADGGDAGAR